METIQPVVKGPLTEGQAPEAIKQEVTPKEEVKLPAQPGSKTEPTELLKSLQEERELRRLAQEEAKLAKEELNKINSSIPSETDAWSDEGKLIVEKYVKPLENTISSLEEKLALKDVQATYPMLKELSSDFDEFRKEYPRHKLDNIAKLFLAEKGLLEPTRKGLEKPTGGPKNQKTPGTMTTAEVKHLRENDHRKYRDMLKKGLIKIEN